MREPCFFSSLFIISYILVYVDIKKQHFIDIIVAYSFNMMY